uniref:Uncharacterized protein n=1 Tax=Phage sp. ct4bw6 TaxID=2826747 RepID=A0A8S5MUF5_9VIRU|nr:MAG TPA: hypothetical protein [Phage sp. ct4bw6]
MKNQYEYTINSTEDISRALAEADRENIYLTHYNSAFYLRGDAGTSISVDDSLADLYVVAYGPAPVWVSGEGRTTVIAEESAVVYATKAGVVDAYDSSTVYAYDRSTVVVQMDASVYVSSDDVDVEAWGDSKVYLPAEGVEGADPSLRVEGAAKVIRGAADFSKDEN